MRSLLCILLVGLSLGMEAQQTHYLWSKPCQGKGSEYCVTETRDPSGNIYVSGFFEDSVYFEPGNPNSLVIANGLWYSDVFVAKYSANGHLLWVKSFGGALGDKPTSIITDQNGNLFLSGMFSQQVDFDPGSGSTVKTSAGGTDGFILNLDLQGNFKKVVTFGGTGYDRIMDLNIQQQQLYAIGDFQQTVDFDPLSTQFMASALGESDICILHLTEQMNLVWMKQVSGKFSEYGQFITSDSFGKIYCGGAFEDSVDFNPASGAQQIKVAYPAQGFNSIPFDSYVLCLDTNGNFSWVKHIGGYEDQQISALDYFQNQLYFGLNYNFTTYANLPSTSSHVMSTSGSYDFLLGTLSNNGTVQQVQRWGGPKSDNLSAISFDRLANIYLCGFFSSTCDFNPDPNVNYPLQVNTFDANAYVLKLNPNQTFVWAKQWRGDAYSQVMQTIVDDSFSVYSIGHWTSTTDMDPDQGQVNVQTISYYDGFLHKMSQCDPVDSMLQITVCDSFLFRGTTYTQSGIYALHIQHPLYCDTNFTLDLQILSTEKPGYSITPKSCSSQPDATLTIDPLDWTKTYTLLPGLHNLQGATFTQLASGVYTLIVQEPNGCKRKESIFIGEKNCCEAPFVPTAFTPNRDGVNDELNILNLSQVEVKQFVIYNRFGNEVYSNTDLWGWDGHYKGGDAELGTYFYVLRYRCKQNDKDYLLKGSVQLLR